GRRGRQDVAAQGGGEDRDDQQSAQRSEARQHRGKSGSSNGQTVVLDGVVTTRLGVQAVEESNDGSNQIQGSRRRKCIRRQIGRCIGAATTDCDRQQQIRDDSSDGYCAEQVVACAHERSPAGVAKFVDCLTHIAQGQSSTIDYLVRRQRRLRPARR